MISNNTSFLNTAPCRKAAAGRRAAKTATIIFALTTASFISPLCPRPASAQLSIGGNGNSGLSAQLSVLQSIDNSLYLNLGTSNQSVANFGLTPGPNGDLFGTTATGGANNQGSVYEVTPSGQIELLHSFGGASILGGTNPSGSLILGPNGDLYGVTQGGGIGNDGTVYQITPAGVTTVLHSFTGGVTDGADPTGSLTMASEGTLTGTTTAGGADGDGTVYQIANAATSPVESLVHSFTGGTGDGSDPTSGVIQAANGDLYGTTASGGASGVGTVFQIADTSSGAAESIVHSFTGGTGDGSDPVGGLIQTASGALAGTTATGGANGAGTVYQIADAATQPTETLLSSLNGVTTGSDPVSSLVQTANGTLIGTAKSGGADGAGTLFDVTPLGTTATIESFANSDTPAGSLFDDIGGSPSAPLVQGAADTLYGTTDSAGLNKLGSVYKVILPESVTGIAPTRFDVNADGYADILFYNQISGAISYWLMDDQTVEQYGGTVASVSPSTGWIPVGEPDTNGDGQPDILFWNKNTGALSIWTLDTASTSIASYGNTFAQVADTNWVPSAIANDQGNGQYEIIFQNTATGAISPWHMNGQTVTSYGGTSASLGANSPWHLVGAPDLTGDGISDYLFWNSSTGDVSYWTMQGDIVQAFHGSIAQVTDLSWHLVASPDLNDDGSPDLLWENINTGNVSRWRMKGAAVTIYGGSFATTGPIATNGWTIQGER